VVARSSRCCEPQAEMRVNLDTDRPSSPMKPLTILVVDDHPIMREVICEMLEDAGHQVRCADDGREALRKLSCARFDLLVTDIVMPEMDGIELIGEVRRHYPEIRIIAMSGGGERFPTNDGLAIARRLGAGAALNKPFSVDQLLMSVEELFPAAVCAA
jgi:CheY-like chemotaxis protein